MYLIPSTKIDKVKKLISKLESKNVKILYRVNDNIKYIKAEDNYHYAFYEIEFESNYIENNWKFVGSLEHTENGNIIRNVTNIEIPEYFYTAEPKCDHCETIRRRKDTFIIQNIKSKVFKQVGKICLLEYTKGLDPKICTEILALESYINSFNNKDILGSELNLLEGESKYYSSNKIKTLAYDVIIKNGYEKNKTFHQIIDLLNEKKSFSEHNEEIKKIDAWAENLNSSNNYIHNALIAWKLDYVELRHFILIASFIYTYLRDNQREKGLSVDKSKFKVGDKIKIKVTDFRVLYTKTSYSYTPELTKVYRIVDDKGYVYIWSTLKSLDDVIEITATIKEFTNYRDENQIVITRGKITKTIADNKVDKFIQIMGS